MLLVFTKCLMVDTENMVYHIRYVVVSVDKSTSGEFNDKRVTAHQMIIIHKTAKQHRRLNILYINRQHKKTKLEVLSECTPPPNASIIDNPVNPDFGLLDPDRDPDCHQN